MAELPRKPVFSSKLRATSVPRRWVSQLGGFPDLTLRPLLCVLSVCIVLIIILVSPDINKMLINLVYWQVNKANHIIFKEGLNMYNLCEDCPHTTVGSFSRHEASLSNILIDPDVHDTVVMIRAKNRCVSIVCLISYIKRSI